jgi:hypothetical protein
MKLAHRYAEEALRSWPDAATFDDSLRDALLEVAARAAAAVLADVSRGMTLERAYGLLGIAG